ncbi:hypothetical protein PIB30_062133 [Stylosanthes scabra]|uniref:Fe2OG dioxygenase domain-containing protein n=1 Tax=Stylosanthes scabra TaxID=79078 RepID=A0ABU6ZJQ7_9FABA|nr:hypothetical protein [Stylosanthes scabra]
MSELKAFDDTKAGGVKGLVDEGLTKVPPLFHHPPDKFPIASDTKNTMIPVIDLEGVAKDPMKRQQVVSRIREACETWGFFQVVNHGIPLSVLDGMKDGIRRFFEQDVDVKKEFYTRDGKKPFFYYGNFDLYGSGSLPLKWRDSFGCHLAPRVLNPQDFPEVCRDIILEYRTNIMKLGITLFELLSETLNLHSNYLRDMELGCTDRISCAGHYYPASPEPELTMGTIKHSDASFLTVLLQDYIDGLQIFHKDKWINIRHVPETLVVNVGDFLQGETLIKSSFSLCPPHFHLCCRHPHLLLLLSVLTPPSTALTPHTLHVIRLLSSRFIRVLRDSPSFMEHKDRRGFTSFKRKNHRCLFRLRGGALLRRPA